MSGHIADGVGLDLGCAQAVKEAQGKHIGQQRQRTGVMGMNNGLRAGRLHNVLEFRGNGCKGLVPTDPLELAVSFGAGPFERV